MADSRRLKSRPEHDGLEAAFATLQYEAEEFAELIWEEGGRLPGQPKTPLPGNEARAHGGERA